MTVKNAKLFIERVRTDTELRSQLNKTKSLNEIKQILEQENLSFTHEEFIEGHSYLLANSADANETENLRLLEKWWGFLTQ